MKPRFPEFATAFFLSVCILWTPCPVSGAEDMANLPVAADNLAVSEARADNAALTVPADDATASLSGNEEFPESDFGETPAPETDPGQTLPADSEALADPATDNTTSLSEDGDFREPDFGEEPTPYLTVADPIEPINRAFFVFNDKLYYWVAKPVAQGYSYVVNEDIRVSVRRFFSNIGTPVRAANNLLQGNLRATGTELLRFLMNSTMGILGFFDVARDFGIEKSNADLGQTFGKYGIGNGMYLVLPVFGPFTLRDGVGAVGDSFLDPVSYLRPWEASLSTDMYRSENSLSLQINLYEEMTGAALDPYTAVKDAYIQNRFKAVHGKPASEMTPQ